MGSSPTRGSSFLLGKVTALGVLCCFALFVYLTLLAYFFLPSHLSYMYIKVKLKCIATVTMYKVLYSIPIQEFVENLISEAAGQN